MPNWKAILPSGTWKAEFAQLRVAVVSALLAAGAVVVYNRVTTGLPSVKLADLAPPRGAANDRGYEFTTDWFSPNEPVWEVAMRPYKGKPNLRYLEIGVHEGRSMVWMLENVLTDPSSTAVAIDPFDDVTKARCLANLKKSGGGDKVSLTVGFSQTEMRKLPLESFDIVYIDGSHTAPDVLEDAVLATRLVKPGGLLIFDDYRWEMGRASSKDIPKEAIDFFYAMYDDRFEVIHNDYQVIMRKKAG